MYSSLFARYCSPSPLFPLLLATAYFITLSSMSMPEMHSARFTDRNKKERRGQRRERDVNHSINIIIAKDWRCIRYSRINSNANCCGLPTNERIVQIDRWMVLRGYTYLLFRSKILNFSRRKRVKMVAKPKCKYRIVYNNTRRGKIRRYGDRSRYSNEVKRNLVFMKNNVHEGSGVYRYIYIYKNGLKRKKIYERVLWFKIKREGDKQMRIRERFTFEVQQPLNRITGVRNGLQDWFTSIFSIVTSESQSTPSLAHLFVT